VISSTRSAAVVDLEKRQQFERGSVEELGRAETGQQKCGCGWEEEEEPEGGEPMLSHGRAYWCCVWQALD
jgi:hypothetical protein